MTEAPDSAKLAKAILGGDTALLSRAITLVESTRQDHQAAARALMDRLIPHAGKSIRIGVTGIPGVGKSTFIEAFGLYLLGQGKRVGVLAVDPSSARSGGSILGDKTRMRELAHAKGAYIRPSPASGKLGGVAAHTREAMLLAEAAGFNVILVETVGAGQSETDVARMVDFFLVLQIPGAGDELQGIKKGILELADMVVVNKAEGENKDRAVMAVRDLKAALHIVTPKEAAWAPPVMMASALKREGIEAVWQKIQTFEAAEKKAGRFAEKRKSQSIYWMWEVLGEGLMAAFRRDRKVSAALSGIEEAVREGRKSPLQAAEELLQGYFKGK